VRATVRTVQVSAGKQKLMWEALREATDEEMEKDPTVCLMGALALVKAFHLIEWKRRPLQVLHDLRVPVAPSLGPM
jgi:hypothetical protein